MYKCIVNLPYKEFNGFRDSGNAMCVPETILHHLKLAGRNKKLKLNEVIDTLESYADADNDIDLNMIMTTDLMKKNLKENMNVLMNTAN
jgi:hypothetical protein